MTIWNKNYLGDTSQPWARQLEKEIDNQKALFQSAEVNNVKRDDQLASSLRQVQSATASATQAATDAADAAAEAAQAALDASAANSAAITANNNALSALQDIVDLGSPGGPTLDARNLTAGTIDAVDIGAVNITGASISGGSISSTGANGTVTVSNGSVAFSGGGKTGSINPTSTYGLGLTSSDRVYISAPNGIEGAYASFAEIDGAYVDATTSFRGTYNTTIASNTTTSFDGNLFINSSGEMFRNPTISSAEAKENITLFEFDTNAFIAVNPVEFNYKREAVLTDEEANANSLGFILEDFEAAGLGEHLVIPANEIDQYKGLRYDKLYMFLHKVVQEQQAKIAELESRITTLEG